MAYENFTGQLDAPGGYIPFDGALDEPTPPKRREVPAATIGSVARDIAAGALQIGPTAVKGVADIARLATGDRVGKDTADAMERGMSSIRDTVGSERAAAQRENFQRDMADDSVGIGEALARNKGALADQILPTVGSMFLPVGVAGAAGKVANATKAAQALDAGALAARVAAVQKAAGVGATAAQNAASTFAELVDKGVSMQDAYLGAGITVPFSVVAGALTGGGAEVAAARALTGMGAAKLGARQLAKAAGQEGAQEMGEELGQIAGEAVATGQTPSAVSAGKQLAVAGALGAVMGGGVDVAAQVGQRGQPAAGQPGDPAAAPTAGQQPSPEVSTVADPEQAGAGALAQDAPSTGQAVQQTDDTPASTMDEITRLESAQDAAAAPEGQAEQGSPGGEPLAPAPGAAAVASQEAAQAFDPGAVQAKTWPQFVLERGEKVSTLRKGTPQWDQLQQEWAAVKTRRAGTNPEGTGAVGAATPEIQNRDRSRPASVVQMQGMAQNPDYLRLGVSRSPESGAPMVFAVGDQTDAVQALGRADVAVMSDGQRVPFRYGVMEAADVQPSNFADGSVNPRFDAAHPGTVKALNNGRTAGLRAAYERGTADAYRQELAADSAMHGIDPAVIEGMKAPVLVRLYSEKDNRSNMGAKSQGQALGLSAAEQAATDAALVDGSVLEVFDSGALDSAANRDFARAFIGKLQEQGQDVAGMMDANGALSPAGVTRLQAALVHKAYGDGDLVESLFGSTDNDIRAIGESLKAVAGEWAAMRLAAERGAINAQVDVTENLLQAIRLVQKARRERASLYDAVQQVDMLTGDVPNALTVGMLRLLYSGEYLTRPTGRDRLVESLRDYMGAALATSVSADMFGEQVGPAAILAALSGQPITEQQTNGASTTTDATPAAQGSRQPAGSDPAGRRADESGSQARGQEPAGAGQAAAETGRGRTGQDAQDPERQQDRQGAQGDGQDSRGAVAVGATPSPGNGALETENPPSVLSRVNPDGTGIHPQAGLSKKVVDALAAVKAGISSEPAGISEAATGVGQKLGDQPAAGSIPTVAREQRRVLRDTRGTGVRLHGTSRPLPAGGPTNDGVYSGNVRNIYGQGFYTTDAADIAAGYTRKGQGGEPTVYEISERSPVRLYDMDTSMEPDVRAMAARVLDDLARDENGETGEPITTLAQLFDEARAESRYEGVSADELQERFDSIRYNLEGMGYRGFTHVGGQKTGSPAHQVNIYWYPEDDLDVTRSDLSRFEEPSGKAPAFKRGDSAVAPAMTTDLAQELLNIAGGTPQSSAAARPARAVAQAQKVADSVRAAWENAPPVNVVFDMRDPRVPQEARDADQLQAAEGATGVPQGFYFDGEVYLVASQLETAADTVRVLYHEALGHHGLRGAFGPALDGVLDQIVVARPREIQAKLTQYGLPDDLEGRRYAAEEVLAEMAEKRPELGFVRRAVAAIRAWLRAHIPAARRLALSDAEIIRDFILPARNWVERGGIVQGRASRSAAAFSLSADALAQAKAKWSAVVDQFVRGSLDETKTYEVLPSSTAVMKLVGLPDLPIRAGVHALEAVYNHGVTPRQLKQVLDELANPPLVMIWNKGSRGEMSLNFVTSMGNSDGQPFVVAIKPNRSDRTSRHHWMATVTQKQPRAVLEMVREGGALYVGDGSIPGVSSKEIQEALRFAKEKRGKEARDLMQAIGTKDSLPNLVQRVLYAKDLEAFKAQVPTQGGDKPMFSRSPAADLAIYERLYVGGGEIAGIDAAATRDALRFAKEKRGKEARELKAVMASSHKLPNLVQEELYAEDLKALRAQVPAQGGGKPMFSRGPAVDPVAKAADGTASWEQVQVSAMQAHTDRAIYEMQDGRIDLKRTQEAIAQAGRDIDERFDARLAETLLPGRVAYRTQTFLEREVTPLLRVMARMKVSQTELGDFLHARAAPERNAQIAKVNPEMPDGGAGSNSQGLLLTTAAAQKYIADLPAGRRRQLEELAAKVDAITKGTRELLVAEGLEKAETIKAWEGAYKHYVPMFREDIEFGGGNGGAGGAASKRATGSEREAVNILSNILLQREAAIGQAESNRFKVSLYGLALSNPNPDFWATIRPASQKKQIAQDLERMGVDPDVAEAGMQGVPTIRTVDPATNQVVDRINPMYKSLPGAMTLKVNGEVRVLMFNAKNERAMRMVGALKGTDGLTNFDLAGSIVGKTTRWLAAVNTQYNLAFGVVNFVRDTLGGAINLSSTALRGNSVRLLGQVPDAMSGIGQALLGKHDSEWSKLYTQFQADGGQTGFREMFNSSSDRAREVQRQLLQLEKAGKLTPMNAARKALKLLDGCNTVLENAVRLSAYKLALDRGISRPEAARLARELTVDFNRKGRTGRELGPLYAFLNASLQGTERTLRTLRGPDGAKIIAGGLALGVAQALLLAMAGFDDDELQEFTKARALILPLPFEGKRYVALPLPLGLHVLPNTGRVLTELVIGDHKNAGARLFDAVGEIAGAINPLGGGNVFTMDGALRTVAPTIADPLIELGFNKNFAGSQIEKEGSDRDPRPGTSRARESTQRSTTGQAYMEISRVLNTLSGGSEYEAGLVSPTPERVRYIAQTAGGGVLRELEKIINTSTAAARGDEVKASQFPLVSRFGGSVDEDRVAQTRYFNNVRRLERTEGSLNAAKKAGNGPFIEKLLEERQAEVALIQMGNAVQAEIAKLNKLAVSTVNDREMLRQIDQARVERMLALNDAVRELELAENGPTIAQRMRVR